MPAAAQIDARARPLLETDRAFSRLSAQKGAAAFAAFLAPDAVSLPNAENIQTGRAAIGRLFWTSATRPPPRQPRP